MAHSDSEDCCSRSVTICMGRNHYSLQGLRSDCTLGWLKQQLGDDALNLGGKLLYASKLQCRLGPPPAPLLKETDRVPMSADAVLHVCGPTSLTKSLELLLKKSHSVQVLPKPVASDGVASQSAPPTAGKRVGSDGPTLKRAPIPEGAVAGTTVEVKDPISGGSFYAHVSLADLQRGYFDCEVVETQRPASNGAAPSSAQALATAVMAAPLGEAWMKAVLDQHPDFPPSALPNEACWWSEERFLDFVRREGGGSPTRSGEVSALLSQGNEEHQEAPGTQTRRLVQALRLLLAERKVAEADEPRQALCRHLREVRFGEWSSESSLGPLEVRALQQLPIMNSTAPNRVARKRSIPFPMASIGPADGGGSSGSQPAHAAAQATQAAQATRAGQGAAAAEPVVLEEAFGADRCFAGLNLDALKASPAAQVRWICSSHSPLTPAEDEADVNLKTTRATVAATLEDYIHYMDVVASADPFVREEEALAFHRVQMESIPLFSPSIGSSPTSAASASLAFSFQSGWKDFVMDGLDDLTLRWARMFADELQLDWLEVFSRFFTVSLAAPGCLTRLHRSNNAAHLWIHQVQGRQLYVLYAPGDASKLYLETLSSSSEMRQQAAARWRSDQEVDCMPAAWSEAVSTADLFSPSRSFPEMRGAEAWATVLEPGETLLIPSRWTWAALALDSAVSLQHRFYNRSNHASIVDELQDCMVSFGDNTLKHLERLKEVIAEDAESFT